MTILRNIFTYLWFGAVLVIRLPLRAKVERLIAEDRFEEAQRYIWAFANHLARVGVKLLGVKLTVKGTENVPKEGSVLYVGNHQSMADPPVMLAAIPRPSAFICKEELDGIPVFSRWVSDLGSFYLPRTESRKSLEVILGAAKLLKKNEHGMCIFPEGTRSDNGDMRPFKPGSLKIATKSGAAIVPFAIENTINVLPRGSFFFKPLPVTVTFLPAILPEEYKGRDTQSLTDQIQADIARIVGCQILPDEPTEKEARQ
ncbi:MAG: lysophospholipid acyltransferase family protein [Peptococcaceae bacterium]|nr:lysophospholipid acyltransferase family protein [Peptococcaceae bacterium]